MAARPWPSPAESAASSTPRWSHESVAERTVAPAETAHNEPFEVTAGLIADGIRAADAWSRSI